MSTTLAATNSDEEPQECPLCLELFELDDLNFYPCSCGYQICRFCWNKIRTEGSGLCPACRSAYSENPADFKPLTAEELSRIKAEKRQRDIAKKQRLSENRRHLANVRVVQQNLVFVIGLSERLADVEMLKRADYFGKFGKIHKVVINHSTSYAGTQNQGPSASAYVTYFRCEDALRAIESVNNIFIDGRTIKASLGTTKYCSHFLKNQPCPKTDCMYLHELGDEAASFTKEEMQQGKHNEYEKSLHEAMANNENNNSSHTNGHSKNNGSSSHLSGTNNNSSHHSNSGSRKETTAAPSNKSINKSPSPSEISKREQRKPQNAKKSESNSERKGSEFHHRNKNNKKEASVSPQPSNDRLLETVVAEVIDEEEQERVENGHEEQDETEQLQCNSQPSTTNNDVQNDDDDEDELGFDPFHETQKALAELLESESCTNEISTSQSFMNSHSSDHDDQPIYMSSSSLNHHGSKGKPVPPPGFGMTTVNYDNHNSITSAPQHQRFSNDLCGHSSLTAKINSEPIFSHYNGVSSMQSKDWQDGLRALLPNVNVSFGNNIEGHGHLQQQLEQRHIHVIQGNESSSNSGNRFLQHRTQDGWNSSVTHNANDWTFLDPAIVSSQLASSNEMSSSSSLGSWRERSMAGGHASVPAQMHQTQHLTRFFGPNVADFENNRVPMRNIGLRQQQQQQGLWGESVATPPGFGSMNNSRPLLSNSFQQMSIAMDHKSQSGMTREQQNNLPPLHFQRIAPS